MNETQAAPTTEAAPLFRGRYLPCLLCGAEEASVSLNLADGDMTCGECEGTFNAETVEAFIAQWRPVLNWLRGFPAA